MGCGASKGKGGDNKISPEEEILQEDTDAQVAQGEAQMKEKQVVEAVLAPSPFFLAPEMVEDAFVRAPFLKGAFDNKGVKYPHCPDDVARTYLHYDKLVFSPSPMQTEEGNLNDIVYSFQRPSHWQVKVTTGAEMDKLITKLAETLPEVAKRLNGDSQIKKAEQVAAYKRVQMGDFSENKVHMLQMTTELINEKSNLDDFAAFKLEQLKTMTESIKNGHTLPANNRSWQAHTLGGLPSRIVQHLDKDEDGSGTYYIFLVPRPGQGLTVLVNWTGLPGAPDAAAKSKMLFETVLSSVQLKVVRPAAAEQ